MEDNSAMGRKNTIPIRWLTPFVVAIFTVLVGYLYYPKQTRSTNITVLISPYQDLAMLTNIEHLGLEKKYGTSVEIITIPWEETYPTLLSASKTADMGFASYADFLTKRANLNKGSDDPLLFISPAYIFKGGSFITFKDNPVVIDKQSLDNPQKLKAFLGQRLGFPKSTLYQMIVYYIARKAGVKPDDVKFTDVGFDAGLLGAKAGDLDVTAVGLTQLTEALRDQGDSCFRYEHSWLCGHNWLYCTKEHTGFKTHACRKRNPYVV